MALKADRFEQETDITMTCPSVASRGVGLCVKTSGSGVALGDSASVCDLFASPSGQVFAGVLMNDVVNIDLTRYHINFHKDEVPINYRVRLLRKGWVITDQISGTPTVGQTAYLTTNGQFTPTLSATGGLVATPKAGRFESIKDASGFVKLAVNIPT
jgi:hypothetical protein